MNAAVLLPGPSLASLEALPAADVLIGVKRAATHWPCDWAIILDIPCLQQHCPALIGSPQLVTRAAYRPKYTTLAGLDVESLAGFCPVRCDEYTSTAALVLAGYLGAKQITAYGADFGTGESLAEFDGFTSLEANYTPERWARETAAWDRAAAWLSGRGVTVERIRQ